MSKQQVTEFDFENAFKALSEIEAPKVHGLRPNKVDLTETFTRKLKTDLLLEDYYDVDDQNDLEAAAASREDEIAKAKLARIEKIVDLDAESADDIQPSYAGKIIVQCPQCMTLFYKNEEDLEPSEEDETIVNVGEACQHCNNVDGYSVVGKVAPVEDSELSNYTNEEEINLEEPEAEENNEEEPEEENNEESAENGEEDLDLDLDLKEPEEEKKEESLNKSKALTKNGSKFKSDNLTLNEDIDDDLAKLKSKVISKLGGSYAQAANKYEFVISPRVDILALDKNNNTILINKDLAFEGNIELIAALVKHELAHVFLNRTGMSPEEADKEIAKNHYTKRDKELLKNFTVNGKTYSGITEGLDDDDIDDDTYLADAKAFAEEIAGMTAEQAQAIYDDYGFDTVGPEDEAEQAIYDALCAKLGCNESLNLSKFEKDSANKCAIKSHKDSKWYGLNEDISAKAAIDSIISQWDSANESLEESLNEGIFGDYADLLNKYDSESIKYTLNCIKEANKELDKDPKYLKNGKHRYVFSKSMPRELQVENVKDILLYANSKDCDVDLAAELLKTFMSKIYSEGVVDDAVKSIMTEIGISESLEESLRENLFSDYEELLSKYSKEDITDALNCIKEANKELDKDPKYLKNGKHRYVFSKSMPRELQVENVKDIILYANEHDFNVDLVTDIMKTFCAKVYSTGVIDDAIAKINSIIDMSESLNEGKDFLPDEPTEADYDELLNSKEMKSDISEEEVEDIIAEESLDKLEDLDEKSLDENLSNYYKAVYANVKSYKTTGCKFEGTKLIVEGLVSFKSGKKKATEFEFEAKNRVLEGINKDINRHKAFKVNYTVKNKTLFTESVSYKYVADKKLVEGCTNKKKLN